MNRTVTNETEYKVVPVEVAKAAWFFCKHKHDLPAKCCVAFSKKAGPALKFQFCNNFKKKSAMKVGFTKVSVFSSYFEEARRRSMS